MSYVTITYDEAFPAAMRADPHGHAQRVQNKVKNAGAIKEHREQAERIAKTARKAALDASISAAIAEALAETFARAPLARTIYAAPIGPGRNYLAMAQMFMADVCKRNGISQNDLLSERRTRNLVYPRQELIWLLKENTPWSYPRIGRFMNRDHTSAIYSVRKYQERLDRIHTDGKPRKSGSDLLPRETRE